MPCVGFSRALLDCLYDGNVLLQDFIHQGRKRDTSTFRGNIQIIFYFCLKVNRGKELHAGTVELAPFAPLKLISLSSGSSSTIILVAHIPSIRIPQHAVPRLRAPSPGLVPSLATYAPRSNPAFLMFAMLQVTVRQMDRPKRSSPEKKKLRAF